MAIVPERRSGELLTSHFSLLQRAGPVPSPALGNREASAALCVTTISIVCCRACRDEQLGDVSAARIEVAGRLVAEQQPRAADQRARDRDALALAARELGRPMIDAIGEADLRRSVARARSSRRPDPRSRDQRRHQHVLEHRALRQQAVILEDEADLAGCGTPRARPARAETGSWPSSVDGAGGRRLERRRGCRAASSCRCPTAP